MTPPNSKPPGFTDGELREILAQECEKVGAPADVIAALRNRWLEEGDQSASCIAALAAMRRVAPSGADGWRDIKDKPDPDHTPSRQFIIIDGERTHSGVRWARKWAGEAFVDNRTPTGYRIEDIRRILLDGDMDPFNYEVTHWMPFRLPPFPAPPPPSSSEYGAKP